MFKHRVLTASTKTNRIRTTMTSSDDQRSTIGLQTICDKKWIDDQWTDLPRPHGSLIESSYRMSGFRKRKIS